MKLDELLRTKEQWLSHDDSGDENVATHVLRHTCGTFPLNGAGPLRATRTGTRPGELAERGYDAVRIDVYPHLMTVGRKRPGTCRPVDADGLGAQSPIA